jgi:hypothetical protein
MLGPLVPAAFARIVTLPAGKVAIPVALEHVAR